MNKTTNKLFWFNFSDIKDFELVFKNTWFETIEKLSETEIETLRKYLKKNFDLILNKQLKTQGDVMNQKDFQTEVMRQFAKINGRLDVIEADIVEIKSDIGVLKKAVIKLNEKVFGVAALEV